MQNAQFSGNCRWMRKSNDAIGPERIIRIKYKVQKYTQKHKRIEYIER